MYSCNKHQSSRRFLTLLSIGLALSTFASADQAPDFQRVTDWVKERIATEKEGGVQLLIARSGDVVYEKRFGELCKDTPIPKDAIFYVHSMTKPLTSLAAMMLFEEGRFLLHDPIHKYLPEFKDMQVYVSGTGEDILTRPAETPITIKHLMTHQSGFVYDWAMNKELGDYYRSHLSRSDTLEEKMLQLSSLPLAFNPGSDWNYGMGTNVLARLVEVVSGQPFAEFLAERVTGPIGMKDTKYYVPPEQEHRRSAGFERQEDGRLEPKLFDPQIAKRMPTYTPGDTGISTTARDYFRFLQMFLDGGKVGDKRIVSSRTIELMLTDFVPPSVSKPLLPPGRGWSLAFSVYGDHSQTGAMVTPGSVTWGGSGGSVFWIDPQEEMIVIFLTQTYPPNQPRMQNILETMVYSSLRD